MRFLVTILAVHYMHQGCEFPVSRELFYIKSIWIVLKAQHWM